MLTRPAFQLVPLGDDDDAKRHSFALLARLGSQIRRRRLKGSGPGGRNLPALTTDQRGYGDSHLIRRSMSREAAD